MTLLQFAVLISSGLAAASPTNQQYFKIAVVDEQTGRGVPLVELQTTNNIRYYTDSSGLVAFYEPGLMNQRVFFRVKSHGYEYPKDGFGMAGTVLNVAPGGAATLKIKRINVAERLYRVTGGGIYRDAVLLGLPAPTREPVLDGQVFGSDSVMNVIYQNKLWWLWGDTNRPSYPLGNFHMTGATSLLPDKGGLDPEVGVDLTYFLKDDGFVKEMAPNPAPGPVWLDALITLKDDDGKERLFAGYARVNAAMEAQERGLLEFNDDKKEFERIKQFELDAPVQPGGHPFKLSVDGVEFIYFDQGFPLTRVRADVAHFTELSSYETYTCLMPESTADKPKLDRGPDGALLYSWKKGVPAVSPKQQADLIKAGQMKPEEALIQVRDADTGKAVQPHASSVYWNDYRKRWVMIVTEIYGTSVLGEIWYLEADTPVGPWVYARKIITHDTYSFYNPKQHPYFARDNGRIIYFEGTYTTFVSGNNYPTPRYDYNQIMYKLDLADPRLILPVPIYQLSGSAIPDRFGAWDQVKPGSAAPPIAFFALDRPSPGSVRVEATETPQGSRSLRVAASAPASAEQKNPLFFALPPDMKDAPATTTPLYEFVHKDGSKRVNSTDPELVLPDYKRQNDPICRVWKNPRSISSRQSGG
jgi:hypothetical protein